MADQELRLGAKAEHFDAAAREVDKLSDATKRLEVTQEDVDKASDKQAESTGKAAASQEDFLGILREIHPALGTLGESMLRGTKIAGDFANKEIDLSRVGKVLTGTLKENADALLAVGAGGAVAAAIGAIVTVVSKLADESERATRAIKEQVSALNELEGQRRDTQAQLEYLSGARRGGGLGPEQSRAALSFRERTQAQFGRALPTTDLDPAIAGLFDRGFSEEQIIQAAFLARTGFTIDPKERADRIGSRLASAISKNRVAYDEFREGAARQRRKAAIQAGIDPLSSGGPTVDLTDAVRRYLGPGASDEKVQRIAEYYSQFGNEAGLDAAIAKAQGFNFGPAAAIQQQLDGTRVVGPDGAGFLGTVGVTDRITASDLADLRNVMRQVGLAVERFTNEYAGRPALYIDNSRNVGPDAASRRKATRSAGNEEWLRLNERR